MLCGLWRKRCQHESTRIALSLVQHSMWDKGEEVLGELNRQTANGITMVSTWVVTCQHAGIVVRGTEPHMFSAIWGT